MSINNNFLSLTVKKQFQETNSANATEFVNESVQINDFEIPSDINLTSKGASSFDICGNLSDEEIVAYMDALEEAENTAPVSATQEITEPDAEEEITSIEIRPNVSVNLSVAEANKIKQTIYEYRHPEFNFQTYGNGGSKDRDFDNLAASIGITPSKSITKADLYGMTQNDALEDANYDFCGALNRYFCNESGDYEITYKELQIACMRMGGYDATVTYGEYKWVADVYSQQLQTRYRAMSDSDKFDFILNMTREYCETAGMYMQVEALDRLLNQTGTRNTNPEGLQQYPSLVRGQIAFVSYSDPNTAGGYTAMFYQTMDYVSGEEIRVTKTGAAGGTYLPGVYATDDDVISGADLGLTLSIKLLQNNNYKWYDLVQVMVHELTHATAFYFVEDYHNTEFDVDLWKPSAKGLAELADRHIINDEEFNHYSNDWEQITHDAVYSGDYQEISYIMYLIDTMTNEYSAYTQSADYYDSLGDDVIQGAADWHNLLVNGPNEASALENHIRSLYPNSADFPVIDDYQKYKAIYR